MDPIEELQLRLRDFAGERHWDHYHTPGNLAALISTEAGELLALFRWGQDASVERQLEVQHELADVFLGVVRFADCVGIDLVSAAYEKIAINELRYPVRSVAGPDRPARIPDADEIAGLEASEKELWRLQRWLGDLAEVHYKQHAKVVAKRFVEIGGGIRLSADDSGLLDVWDEFKDQIQGQQSIYFRLYEDTMSDLVERYVSQLPPDEVQLLTFGTREFEEMEPEERGDLDYSAVEQSLYSAILTLAADEPLASDLEWEEKSGDEGEDDEEEESDE
jgi:dCTP diphosphatase